MVKTIARLMWLLPLLLIAIAISLTKAAFDIRATLTNGIPVEARVLEFRTDTRAEITYGHVELEARVDGETYVETLPLPLSLLLSLEGRETLPVRVVPGAAQPIVIEEIARPQWRLSLINAVFSLVGAVLLIVGVGAWNRYLNRRGDPATALPVGPASA